LNGGSRKLRFPHRHRDSCDAVPHHRRKAEHGGVTQELANEELRPTERVGQQQEQRAAFAFAHDRVEAEKKRYERQQKYCQAREADNCDFERADADCAGWGAAEKAQAQGKPPPEER
jgi:hypothetical protein